MNMKDSLHPKYEEVSVRCACGNEFVTRSTKKELSVVLCNECHPFYTGKQKFVDTAGRIEKFQKRFNMAAGAGTDAVVKAVKQLSKKQIQAAAIQEEKRIKAERKAPKKTEGDAAAAPENEVGAGAVSDTPTV